MEEDTEDSTFAVNRIIFEDEDKTALTRDEVEKCTLGDKVLACSIYI